MTRGTTSQLIFTTKYLASEILRGFITFKQNNKTILDKSILADNVTISDYQITLDLSQAETLAFGAFPDLPAYVQLRLVLSDGDVVASNIIQFNVNPILKEGPI